MLPKKWKAMQYLYKFPSISFLFIFTRWKLSLQPFEALKTLKIHLVWVAAFFLLIWAFLALASVYYLKLAQPAGLRNREKLIRTCKVYAWHHHFNSCMISSQSTKKFQEDFVARTLQEMGAVPQEVKDNLATGYFSGYKWIICCSY